MHNNLWFELTARFICTCGDGDTIYSCHTTRVNAICLDRFQFMTMNLKDVEDYRRWIHDTKSVRFSSFHLQNLISSHIFKNCHSYRHLIQHFMYVS